MDWDIIYTGNTIFPFTQGNNISTQRNTRGLVLELPFDPPQTAREGGESPTPFPNLSLHVLKCPFRALSPCPIQILAGALSSDIVNFFIANPIGDTLGTSAQTDCYSFPSDFIYGETLIKLHSLAGCFMSVITEIRGDQIFFSATCPGQVASKNPLVLKNFLHVPKYFSNRKSISQIAHTTISYLKCNSNQYMRGAVT